MNTGSAGFEPASSGQYDDTSGERRSIGRLKSNEQSHFALRLKGHSDARRIAMKNKIAFAVIPAALAATTLLGAVAAQADTINQRFTNQHARIAQGTRSGELTYREQARVESRDASIHRQDVRFRANHGGQLSSAERVRLNRELNANSRKIYNLKHNGSVRAF